VEALEPFLLELIRQVQNRVAGPLIPRIDAEEIVFAALKSLLTGVRKEEFPALANHENVMALLNELVSRTLSDAIRHTKRKKRTPCREERSEHGVPRDVAAPPQAALLAADLAEWVEKFEK